MDDLTPCYMHSAETDCKPCQYCNYLMYGAWPTEGRCCKCGVLAL